MGTKMVKVTKEEKANIIRRMMPPYNERVVDISEETGINQKRLYGWRKQAKETGDLVADIEKSNSSWSSKEKFMIVVESMSMNEAELGDYCRRKGLYRDQLESWKFACMGANGIQVKPVKDLSSELKESQQKEKELSKELRKKEKALAEAAALLLLRKKAHAIWGEDGDEA